MYISSYSHKCVAHFDECLSHGDFKSLMRAIAVDFDTLFSNEILKSHELLDEDVSKTCVLRSPDLEKHIKVKHAKLMAIYKKELDRTL